MPKFKNPGYKEATIRRRVLEHFGVEEGSVVLYEHRYTEGGEIKSFFYPATVNSIGQGGRLSLRCYDIDRRDEGKILTKNQIGLLPIMIFEGGKWVKTKTEYTRQIRGIHEDELLLKKIRDNLK